LQDGDAVQPGSEPFDAEAFEHDWPPLALLTMIPFVPDAAGS